jgi:hypothetical protein
MLMLTRVPTWQSGGSVHRDDHDTHVEELIVWWVITP